METKPLKSGMVWVYVLIALLASSTLFGQTEGEQLFNQICIACHTIGKGKLIGPDLANVQQRRSEDWLLRFIRSSQTVIKSGDPIAVQLFNDYNQMVMPDNNFSDAQIRAILDYIAQVSGEVSGVAAQAAPTEAAQPALAASPADIQQGQEFFEGRAALSNGGPSCISCHNVQYSAIVAGGALAKDLSDAFSRLGEAGIRAILTNPPFPAMSRAYAGKPLSDNEVVALLAFLQEVDRVRLQQQAKNYLFRLLLPGLGGAAILLMAFGGFWTRTKRRSVNQAIFDRQIKSM